MLTPSHKPPPAVAFAGALAIAQTPPSPDQIAAQRVARLTTLLSLTSGQQSSASTIYTAEATAITTLFVAVQTAQSTLEAAVDANDSAEIANAANQLGALNGREAQARASADAAFLALRTADQKTKYKGIFSAIGPGGPGRPGPAGFGARAMIGR